MSDSQNYEGEVVRVEPSGFGVVRFTSMVGAKVHGIFSTDLSKFDLPFDRIRPGLRVRGLAEVDDHDLAAIRTISEQRI